MKQKKPMIMDNVDKYRQEILDFAQKILDMEGEFDYSMRGFFIDYMVTAYVEKNSEKLNSMFEFILENQKEIYDTYGDIDSSVTKIKVNVKPRYEDTECSAYGMLIRDIFSGNDFIIIKKITKHIGFEDPSVAERFKEVELHIRRVTNNKSFAKYLKKPSSDIEINFEDVNRYGDLRDDGYVLTYKTEYHTRGKFKVESDRGMAFFYRGFKEVMDVLHDVHYELNENLNNKEEE